jgi:non-lysosomal glucosylceramidase
VVGLFAGTVYLGGDGRLWLWNIQNDDREGIEPRNVEYKGRHIRMRDGANYVAPACRRYPFEQNFAIRIGDTLRPLDSTGFKGVTFFGRYPMAEVTFEDPECPARVTLTAYSPFIPLNTPDSSLPVTIMSYRIENRTSSDIECEVIG